jgi:hypothetical protein
LISCLCLEVKSRALVLNTMAENLDVLKCGGWGVFIALTTKMVVGETVCRWAHRTVRCATGHCLVRQPRHPTVRVLMVSTVGALTDWGTGQSGAAPNSHCSLSGAPSGAALTLRALSMHCSRSLFTFADDRWRSSHCSAWHTGHSGATPDSPVNYSAVALQKLEAEQFRVDLPGAPDTVRCARPGQPSVGFAPFFLNPILVFLLVCVEPLAPVELII